MKKYKVIIIGGGLAGLTAAIHLSKIGLEVIVIEKNDYPKHKVCGEYISNEVLPYLTWLDLDLSPFKPTKISQLHLSTTSGKSIEQQLPMGGFGISRYTLDLYLYKKAISNGCSIIEDAVENVVFEKGLFTISTLKNEVFQAPIAIGAFGKRSNLDAQLQRSFFQKKSPWLAVKAHYSGTFPNDLVGLHNFEGGYCGVSKVENDVINICYLTNYNAFKKHKNIRDFEHQILCKNPVLKDIFDNSQLVFDKPLTISQIYFDKKTTVQNHLLMIGDTAGLIHPLCGNGMAMAIHSAKIACELIEKYSQKSISTWNEVEQEYTKSWQHHFGKRLKAGRMLSQILQNQQLSRALLRILVIMPFLLPIIIKKTHGKPIQL